MKTLSIIVPTYNVEDYLDKCLDSLIVNRDDLEVFVIIDGSKDRSIDIANKYRVNYPLLFKVIEKENGHYGSCVNIGLSMAQGKYIKVLDADDYLDPNFINYLEFLSTVDADLILTDYTSVDSDYQDINTRRFSIGAMQLMKINSVIDRLDAMHHATITWRTELLRSIDYRQTEGIAFTDLEWVFLPFSQTKTVIYYPKTIYRYLRSRTGQTIDIDFRKKNQWMENKVVLNLTERYEQLKHNDYSYNQEFLRTLLSNYITSVYYHYLLEYPNQLKETELIVFDEKLRNSSEEMYQLVNDTKDKRKYGTFYYIKDFRDKGTRKNMTYYFYDLCRFISRIVTKIKHPGKYVGGV